MIVACSENGVIGRDGDLPWSLRDDLRHFMQSTKGCPVIMGRKTFESLEKPLPNRLNIVLSRSMGEVHEDGVIVVGGLEAAIEAGEKAVCEDGQSRPIWIAGGGTIYRQAMDAANLLVVTRVHCEVEGDTTFPEIDMSRWEMAHSRSFEADNRNQYAFTIEWWQSVAISGQ